MFKTNLIDCITFEVTKQIHVNRVVSVTEFLCIKEKIMKIEIRPFKLISSINLGAKYFFYERSVAALVRNLVLCFIKAILHMQ